MEILVPLQDGIVVEVDEFTHRLYTEMNTDETPDFDAVAQEINVSPRIAELTYWSVRASSRRSYARTVIGRLRRIMYPERHENWYDDISKVIAHWERIDRNAKIGAPMRLQIEEYEPIDEPDRAETYWRMKGKHRNV